MRILRFIGSVFCVLTIVLICILASSVFNTELSEKIKDIGEAAISAIKEFSEQAEVNVFSEGAK